MSNRHRFPNVLLTALMVVAFTAGCVNVFDFASDKEESPIEKAEEAIRDGNYDKARAEMAEAGQDSTDVMVLYTNAKIALLDAGIDIATVVDLIEGQDGAGGEELSLLEVIDQLSTMRQNDWYRGNREALANLRRIYKGQVRGILSKDDIGLDYSVTNVMSGVLGIRDTNSDGTISTNDFNIGMALKSIGTSEGFSFDGAVFEGVTYPGLTAFLGDTPIPSKAAADGAGVEGYTPDDINPFIASIMPFLGDGYDAVVELVETSYDTSTFNLDDIEEYFDQIVQYINFYWYNDGLDNDGDGVADEELINGEDDDNDGLVDEDTDHVDPAKRNSAEYDHNNQAWIDMFNQYR